jgi:predicted pyridoxine 5'-phosphate oxidase superfamily flavin-nucleotide-binding protein
MNEETKNIIENNPLALSTINQNNDPHCNVVAYVKVVEDKLLITDNYMFTTKENIKSNPNVCLVVWNKDWETKCTGYRIKGKAEYFNEGKWCDFVKEMPENKGYPCKGAILITIEDIKKLA